MPALFSRISQSQLHSDTQWQDKQLPIYLTKPTSVSPPQQGDIYASPLTQGFRRLGAACRCRPRTRGHPSKPSDSQLRRSGAACCAD